MASVLAAKILIMWILKEMILPQSRDETDRDIKKTLLWMRRNKCKLEQEIVSLPWK